MSKEDPRCPYCGALLEFKDHVRRHRKLAGGEKEWFLIERRSCPAGCGLHRLIPDFLAPFKHYDIDIITGVLNGSITPEKLTFEDYPCERTMERWQELLYDEKTANEEVKALKATIDADLERLENRPITKIENIIRK